MMVVGGVRVPNISLKNLRAVLRVFDVQQVSLAAQEMNKTQSAITKSIAGIENTLELNLFERSSTGMVPTP